MKPAALIFLADDPTAQRLAVSWPAAHADPARWHELAGVSQSQAASKGTILRAHGICLDDGSLDPLAEQFIASQVARAMPRSRT